MAAKLIDLVGNKYERLTVVSHAGIKGRRVHHWLCKCDCGNESVVAGSNLKKGRVKSCGCLNKECDWNKTHGMAKSSTYHIWNSMKMRCSNPNSDAYPYYGARGIKVCDKWADSFEAFLVDMGERPDGMSIDRIDVDGDYAPENCRWATAKEQMRNTRANRSITANGETKLLVEWAETTGFSEQVIARRIGVHGWSPEDAINTPINGRRGGKGSKNSRAKLDEWSVIWIKRMLKAGNSMTYLAEVFGVNYKTVYNIKSGVRWSHVEV